MIRILKEWWLEIAILSAIIGVLAIGFILSGCASQNVNRPPVEVIKDKPAGSFVK